MWPEVLFWASDTKRLVMQVQKTQLHGTQKICREK